MIVCTNCGFQNSSSDAFCGSCGKFLEWFGQPAQAAEPEPSPAQQPEQPAKPEPAGLVDRVRRVVAGPTDGEAAEARAAADARLAAEARAAAAAKASAAQAARAADEAQAAEDARRAAEARAAAAAQAKAAEDARLAAEAEAAQAARAAAALAAGDARAAEDARDAAAQAQAKAAEDARLAAEAHAAEARAAEDARLAAEARAAEDARLAAEARAAEARAAEDARLAAEARAAEVRAAEARAAEDARLAAEARARQAEPPPPPRRSGGPTRRVSIEAESDSQPTAPPPAAPMTAQPQAVQPAPVQPVQVAHGAAQPPPRLPMASAPTQPAPVQPAPVRPVEAAAQPAARRPDEAVAEPARPTARPVIEKHAPLPGELVCGSCGTGNEPARRFCRACGTSLAEARPAVAATLPWWRRLFARKAKQPLAAGQRTKGTTRSAAGGRRRTSLGGILGPLFGILMLLGVGGYIAIPSIHSVIDHTVATAADEIRRRVAPRLVIEPPVKFEASGAQDGHAVAQLFDRATNTWWACREPNPTVTVTFAEALDLGAAIIHSGVEADWVNWRRPAVIEITALDTGAKVTVNLDDVPAQQDKTFDLPGTRQIQIRVVSVRGDASLPLAISEIQLFAKR